MSPRRGGGHVADRASRGHSAPRAGVRAAIYALTLAALFAAPTPALAQDQLGGGWTKVRHVPSGNRWHPAKDRLVGTETYGDSNVDSVAWSIDFESAAPGYNQFLLSSGDSSLWLVATKSAVVGEYYENALRDVMASSSNADAYQARWYRRSGINEDPWISVGNFATGVVYGGNAVGNFVATVQNNGGADVYVRAACDAFTPPFNGDFGTCTGYLVYGQFCVPTCNPGFVLEGVTSCTDGVMTEAVCIPDVATRAELKAAVDACVGDRMCEMTMPHWDVSQVTDMSFLFQNMTGFNVDISQWEMSQVTTAAGMFEGAASFHQDIRGLTLASGADMTGMFTGADTWLSLVSRADGSATTDGPPTAWVASGLCFINEHVQSGWCVACGAGKYNAPGDNPALGVDTRCDTFPDSAALKTAVDNCLAEDPTGVACCNHGADCGAAGTVEMADWDVSPVTSMSELFYNKGSFNADISRWDTSSVTNMYGMFRGAGAFNQDIGAWDTSSVTTMKDMFVFAFAFNQHLSRWDVSSVTTMYQMFYDANAFNTMPVGWDTSKVTDSTYMFYSAAAWKARFTGGGDHTLPGSEWTRKDNACDASLPLLNGAVGTCTDTLVSGTSCVPECDAGYVLRGVTSCTDRVLTEAVCAKEFTDYAQLKAEVDACLDAVPSGELCCSSDEMCLDQDPAYRRCRISGCVDMPNWATGKVTSMVGLFRDKLQFNQAISTWDTSQVTDMSSMFSNATAFDGDLSSWDTSQVTDMSSTFSNAVAFDGDLSSWDVSAVESFDKTFECAVGACRFRGDGLSGWDVRAATSMADMFHGSATFNADVARWDVRSVTDMSGMFANAAAFTADVTGWQTDSLLDSHDMFLGADAWRTIHAQCGDPNVPHYDADTCEHHPEKALKYMSFGSGPPGAWTRLVKRWTRDFFLRHQGEDIMKGDGPGHAFGVRDGRLSVSYEGRRIAAAGTNAGADESSYVRVFEWNVDGVNWTRAGDDDVATGVGSNGGIALSGDGKRLAVGDANGTHSYVTAYHWNATTRAWDRLGDEFIDDDLIGPDGDGTFGYAVSLSRNGYRLAVGSPGGRGFTRVFQWDAVKASWSRMGVDIRGPPTTPTQGSDSSSAGTLDVSGLGAVVRLSLDGNRLAVAVPGAGIARAYEWDRVERRWSTMGGDLTAGTDDAGGGGSIERVAISGDGTVVAVGAPGDETTNGTVAVFRWQRGATAWDVVGDGPLVGVGVGDKFGSSLSLSRDGSRLAVGAEHGDDGYVRVFDWNPEDAHWYMAPKVNLDGTGSDVVLSGNGAILAVAKHGSDDSGAVITHALECDAEAAGPPPNGRYGTCGVSARILNVTGSSSSSSSSVGSSVDACVPVCDEGFELTEPSVCDPFTGGFRSGRCLCPCDVAWRDKGFYM